MTEKDQPNIEGSSPLAGVHARLTKPFLVAVSIIAVALIVALFALNSARTPRETQTAAIGTTDSFTGVSLEAKAAIVIDITNGTVLYEKNASTQLPLASLTKVALTLTIAETLPLDMRITIPYYAGGSTGTEHLSKGEIWPVKDVIDFTLVASSNNGAEILADTAEEAIRSRFPDAPEGSAALWRMNELAKELGLSSTFFLNVNGLDVSRSQAGAYGSARDMALLFAYAASADPSLFSGTARDGVLLASRQGSVTAPNTNRSQSAIPGLIMGKTGLTELAGGNLAIVYDVGLAHPLVAVVLGSSEQGRFADMQKLVASSRKAITGTE